MPYLNKPRDRLGFPLGGGAVLLGAVEDSGRKSGPDDFADDPPIAGDEEEKEDTRHVSEDASDEYIVNREPAWSPDGEKIAFVTNLTGR